MLASAASVSGQPRVLRPQSGLTQRFFGGSTWAALRTGAGHFGDSRGRAASGCPTRRGRSRSGSGSATKCFERVPCREREGFDGDDVGVEGGDRRHDVVELRIAHVGVDLGLVADAGGAEAEGLAWPSRR